MEVQSAQVGCVNTLTPRTITLGKLECVPTGKKSNTEITFLKIPGQLSSANQVDQRLGHARESYVLH